VPVLLGVLTTLAFATQLLAMSGSLMVCRYTGEVLKECCCQRVEQGGARESPNSQVIAECCCEHRDFARADVMATIERSPAKPGVAALVSSLGADLLRRPSVQPVAVVDERSIGPPAKIPLYLFERHLLI
jgi:hypothetical protein